MTRYLFYDIRYRYDSFYYAYVPTVYVWIPFLESVISLEFRTSNYPNPYIRITILNPTASINTGYSQKHTDTEITPTRT